MVYVANHPQSKQKEEGKLAGLVRSKLMPKPDGSYKEIRATTDSVTIDEECV